MDPKEFTVSPVQQNEPDKLCACGCGLRPRTAIGMWFRLSKCAPEIKEEAERIHFAGHDHLHIWADQRQLEIHKSIAAQPAKMGEPDNRHVLLGVYGRLAEWSGK